jgi:PleD family two-component response regulator
MPPDLIQSIIGLPGAVDSILIIDDERGFVQMVERIIQSISRSIKIYKAYGGYEGLISAQTYYPDIIFLDMVLPDIGGSQVLTEIRKIEDLIETQVYLMTSADLLHKEVVISSEPFSIHRLGGLRPGEVLRVLSAVVNALEVNVEPHL